MKKWEYTFLNNYPLLGEINEKGAEGWELINYHKGVYLFKREITELYG